MGGWLISVCLLVHKAVGLLGENFELALVGGWGLPQGLPHRAHGVWQHLQEQRACFAQFPGECMLQQAAATIDRLSKCCTLQQVPFVSAPLI